MKGQQKSGRFWFVLVNLLTGFRLASVPVLLSLAWFGYRDAFLWLLCISFLTDAADGALARLTGQQTEFGARFDTIADGIFYVTIAIGASMLWPDRVRGEAVTVLLLITSFLLPAIAGLLKYRKLTSYHTRLTRFAVLCSAIALLLFLWGGPAWPLRIAALIAMTAALEEVAITSVLTSPRANVRGLREAMAIRTATSADSTPKQPDGPGHL